MSSNVPSSSQDHTLAARVAARVIARAGDAVGAGFLVGPDLVATCAHVVATATGADPYGPEPPPDPVRLDFPMLGDAARAVVHRWLPIAEDGTGDVAVLKLIDPLPRAARMPPLRRIDQLWDQRFRVLGFPEGMADGVWTTGRIRGEQGTRWFQLQTTVGEQPIVEGFSGAPVWHEETGAVVGMTVAADRSGRTTTAYLIPVEQVLGADPELLPCPYRGLEAFGEEHAEFFFGRDADVAALADALAAHPLVAVVGPSGVGKSSLVGAGLVPRLRAEGARVARLTPIPGQPVEPALTAALAGVPSGGGTGKRVLVVDQFEELAAAQPDAARLLLERIGELVTGTEPISAVLTLRSATLDEVVVPELAGLLGAGTVLVPPMQRGQLREAIVAPAERAPGLSFEAGLVDRILDDAAAEPGHLPLVESLLTELWSRRDGGYLTVRGYEEAGGVAGVIATHAEAVLAGFTDPEDPARLRRLLTALARPDRDGGFTRTSLPWADVAPDLRPVVHRLAAGRLVVVARSSTGTEHVQLAHQALIAHWPRLRDWLAEDRDFLAWRAQLDEQRERWEDADRDDGALLRGTPLSTALDWLPARSGDVSEAGREYVRRSRARQRREVRRWRLVTAVLAVLVLAAATLSVVAVTRGNRINDQLRLANAELVAQTALRQAGVDPVAATRLALTAWHLDPGNAAARTALVTQYLAMRSVEATVPDVGGGGGALDSIAVPLGGADRILVRNGRGVTLIDNLAAGRPERWDLPAEGEYRTAGFVDGGRTLLVFAANGDILRWDLATRSGPDRTPTGIVPAGTSLVELDPAATKLAWTQEVGPGVHALELRDTRTGAVIPHRIDPITDPGGVTVELPADPGLVVLQGGTQAARPGPLVVRSLADGLQRAAFPPGSAMASPSDGHVLSCEQDGSVAVLRALADGAEIRRFALLGRCSSELPLRLTADGKHLVEVTVATGDADSRTARITRLDDGQTFGLALPPDTRYALDPARPIPMVVVGSDAAPAVLLAHGTSVLRLRARPVPTDPQVTLWPVDDERYVVGTEASRTTVFDRELRPVAVLDNEQAGITTESFTYVTSGLTMLSRAPQGWTVIDLAVPSLDRRSTRPLAAVTARRPSLEVTEDRIVSKSQNVVTTWDRATGAQLFEPTLLPEADHRSNGSLAIRPGRPDEVVLTKGIGAEIWDLRHRRRIAEIPLTDTMQPLTLAFFPSGDRVVGLTLGSNLEIRSLADLQPVRPAFPAPGTALLLGVTQDEHVLTLRNEDERHVVFWDARRGIESGTFSLPTLYRLGDVTEDGRHLSINAVNGGVPFTMPVTAQQWAERLCAIADLPFTDQDRALLPEGIEADRPCGAG